MAASKRPNHHHHCHSPIADASCPTARSSLSLSTPPPPSTTSFLYSPSPHVPVERPVPHHPSDLSVYAQAPVSRPHSTSSSASSATLVSASSPPPPNVPNYGYMAGSKDGVFQDYYPTKDDELGRHTQAGKPLIDRITNDWKRRPRARDDDDDDDFLYSDRMNWYTPAIVTLLLSQRVPRRVQRAMLFLILFLTCAYLGWRWMLLPYWREQNALFDAMHASSQKYGTFGLNSRPAFTDMIQVKELDSALLPNTESDKQRLVIVGDVHGCKPELVELLHKLDFHPASDHLILTGDIVSKGPDSPGVIDLARDLRASCVRGNHDDRILLARRALQEAEKDKSKNKELGEDEARNAGADKDKELARKLSDKQANWLEQCPVILKVGQIAGMGEVIVAHAGLVPDVDFERQDPYEVMNMRSIDLETKLPSDDRSGMEWEKYWNYWQKGQPEDARSTIVYGHDAKRGLNIKKYSKGLDSGCVYGGELTALVIEANPRGGPVKQSLVSVRCSASSKLERKKRK